MYKILALLVISLAILSCSSVFDEQSLAMDNQAIAVQDATVTGANGTITVSAMTGTSLTVTYAAGKTLNACNLYLSQGNGTGLVLASQPMNNSGGTYSYTFSHSSFTAGAVIYVCILKNDAGVETCVPQGTLGTTTTWKTFVYGSSTATPTPTPTATPAAGTRYQAESYSVMNGIITETTTDTGGGLNVGAVDAGDWMVYPISVAAAGSYTISYRVSSIHTGKTLSADLNAGATQLGSVTVPNTGSWQTWTTVSHTVTLPAGSMNFGINGGTGGWNINWFEIAPASSSSTSSTSTSSTSTSSSSSSGLPSLPSVNANMQMTFQIANLTGGKWASSQIYIFASARRESDKVFCYLSPDGSMTPCVPGDNAKNHSFKVSDYPNWQWPKWMSSGRLYISYEKPIDAEFNVAGDGSTGIAFPNIDNTADANYNTYFDWIEFAIINNEIWVNTSQVDIFGIPMTLSLYEGTGSSYTFFNTVGISQPYQTVLDSWTSQMDATWDTCKQGNRLVAPIHNNNLNQTYFDATVNSVWSQYTSSPMVIDIPQGVFTGYVVNNRLRFTRPGDSRYYYVSKPATIDIWGGLATLAMPSVENQANGDAVAIELALEAQICAAFHRGVIGNTSLWNTPSAYYQSGVYDKWSKFMHSVNLSGGLPYNRAYGFCYDDVNDQSTTMHGVSPRGLILNLYWQ